MRNKYTLKEYCVYVAVFWTTLPINSCLSGQHLVSTHGISSRQKETDQRGRLGENVGSQGVS